ncbi:MAG: PH domain-containing protein [Planctomycetes bacterium]|nr:PH domain-containing protein [Planctomycetota bacterium]
MGTELKSWTGNASRGIALMTGILASAALLTLVVWTWVASHNLNAIANTTLAVLVLGSIWLPLFQWFDAAGRQHTLSADSIVFRRGIWCTYEIEVPFRHVHAVAVQQNLLQKLFGCGDVRLTTLGVVPNSGLVTSADMSSLVLRSIPDHVAVGHIVRERMRAHAAPSESPGTRRAEPDECALGVD